MSTAVRFAAAERVLTQDSGDALLLLDVNGGTYFSLEGVGKRVWALCDGSRSFEDLVDAVCAEYSAPRDVIEADVRELLDDLRREGLVSTVES